MSSLMTSAVLASALVSALVALGIEWLAKPSLEARKIVILERHANRRRALRTCRLVLVRIGMLKSVRSENLTSFRVETRSELLRLSKSLSEELIEIALDLPPVARRLGAHATGLLMGLLSAKAINDAAILACAEPIETLAWILETMAIQPGRWIALRRASTWLAAPRGALTDRDVVRADFDAVAEDIQRSLPPKE